MPAEHRQPIAQHHTHEQYTHERRQFESGALDGGIQQVAALQTDRHQRQGLDKRKRRDQALFIRLFKPLGQARLRLPNTWHLDPLDQKTRHRPADQAAEHQAKGCRGNRQFRRRSHAILLTEHRPPGRAGAMPTGQGHRTRQQAHQRVKPERRRQRDPHGVLHHQQARYHQQKHRQDTPAFLQAGKVGVQTDRGKERQHQRGLQ